jgi:hypothetical protein
VLLQPCGPVRVLCSRHEGHATLGCRPRHLETINMQHYFQYVILNLLFDFPDPRRIASRPLACKASTIAEGAAVPSIETSCSLRLAVILLMPVVCQANDVHRARPSARTTQVAERPFNVFDAGLTGHRHCKCGFERRYSHRES